MKIIKFLRETQHEMRQVIWPKRSRVIIYAVIVILFSVTVGYLLGGFDTLFREALKGVIQ